MAVLSKSGRLKPATVGHIPIEDSRVYYYFERHGGIISAMVLSTKHVVSPIPKRGLEIPVKVSFKHSKSSVLKRMEEYYKNKGAGASRPTIRVPDECSDEEDSEYRDDELLVEPSELSSEEDLVADEPMDVSHPTAPAAATKPGEDVRKTGKTKEDTDSVSIVCTDPSSGFNFCPINAEWQETNAAVFPGGSILQRHPSLPPRIVSHSVTPISHPVSSDGNCFFRAISVCVFGHEMGHECVRKAVCDFIESNHVEFTRVTGKSNYIEEKNKRSPRTWGTDVEIEAVATMVNTIVYTYMHGSWIKHKPLRLTTHQPPLGIRAIYLVNSGLHYEPVFHINA